MKVSKVVLVVVALHVLVIGGIFIFEGCSRAKAPTPDMAANETAPADPAAATATTPALPADTTAAAPSLTPAQPTPAAAPTPVAPVAPVTPARTYTVKKGDTLSKIAKAEHVAMGDLARANNLTKNSMLKINQKLTIPSKAEAPVTAVAAAPAADAAAPTAAAVGGSSYTVKSGDSLWKIAKAHNISVTALKQANNLSSDALKLNQKLTIPTGSAPAAAAAPAPAVAEWKAGTHSENGQTIHVVDVGESLAAIAKKYGVTVTELMKANNITDAKRVTVTQRLVIPAAPAAGAPATTMTPAVAAPIVSVQN